jgi:DNA repair exonuclease SbcCD ATPase subunit
MSRTRRSAQELIEESEARLAKLREKAALDQAKQSPELAPIVEAIREETAAITEAQRGLGSGPQSFESRAAKHEAWLVEINAAEDLAELVLAQAQERKDYLTSALSTLSQSILDGNDVSVDILETLASIPTSPVLEDATIKYGQAHNQRKSLSTSTPKESSNDQPL